MKFINILTLLLMAHNCKLEQCEYHPCGIYNETNIYGNKSRLDLSGITVRATAPEGNLTQGEIVFETLPNGKLHYKSGFGVEILYSLQISLGFQIEVTPAKSWATQFPNGTWFGMAQQVIDGEADLSLAKTSILLNRAKALSYLVPTHGMGLYSFFVQPPSNDGRNIFFAPFAPILWICLLSVYLFLILSIKIITFVTTIFPIDLEESDVIFASQTPTWTVHTICQHGFYTCPKLNCLRIAVISGVFLGLIIYVSYSAQLVSMLSVDTIPIKSMMDLLRSKINIIVDDNNAAAKNMIQETNSTTNEDQMALILRQHLKGQKRTVAKAQDGGDFVLKAQGAFLTFKDTFYTTAKNTYGTTDDEFCQKVFTLSVTNVKFRSGIFVKKGSKLKEPFNIKMVAMYTNGLMQRFVRQYEETYTPTCDRERLIQSAPIISLPDVIFSFYSLLTGFALALLICLGETVFINLYKNSCLNFCLSRFEDHID